MLFNSISFLLFFPVILICYFVLPRRWQNSLLLLGSYFFYAQWDWRFLSLILLSTGIDFYCGRKIDESVNRKQAKQFLVFSVLCNLSLLAYFKYSSFFLESFYDLLSRCGFSENQPMFEIILPVGISFYTFQTMSYTIDIYRGEIKATKKLIDFALFVAFFPQLVAGPIERAKHFLPQITQQRRVEGQAFVDGGYLIFWGLFKKVFIADNLARAIVQPIFDQGMGTSSLMVIIGVYAFAFQIYCDFSGYTDIARGCAKCLGFDLCLNFRLPYFAMNPQDFWSRWHISLSSWLRDYLYISLGGNRNNLYRNLLLTMLLGGLWHGAKWTFVLWGAYQGALLIGHRLLCKPKDKATLSSLGKFLRIAGFFQLTCIGWMIFRADSIGQLVELCEGLGNVLYFDENVISRIKTLAFYASPLLVMQVFQYYYDDLRVIARLPWFVRSLLYTVMFYLFMIRGEFGGTEFIYFQF